MFWSLWKAFLALRLLIPLILNIPLLMKIGPVSILFPMLSLRKYELSSWSQKNVIPFSVKVPILAIFDYLGPPSKSICSTWGKNFEKSLERLLEEVVRNIMLNFQLSIFKKVRRGVAVLQVDLFQNP